MNIDSVVSARQNKSTTVRARKRAPFALRAVRGGMSVLSLVSPEGAAAVAERMFLSPRRRRRPPSEVEILATARRRTIRTEEGDLVAWEWGGDDTAPRVLLVHGWEGRGAQLGALVDPLAELGFRVVTFDAAGHGESPGDRSSLFHFASGIERAAEQLGPFHAIVTHSMGGPSTLWASRHGSLASRLVMIAPPIDLRDFTRTLSRTLGLPESVRGRVHRRLGARFGVPIEDARADVLAPAMHEPLLVIHDEDDREVPIACGEALVRAWPHAELVRTRGLGHQRILRDQQTLRAVVWFVAQRRPERQRKGA